MAGPRGRHPYVAIPAHEHRNSMGSRWRIPGRAVALLSPTTSGAFTSHFLHRLYVRAFISQFITGAILVRSRLRFRIIPRATERRPKGPSDCKPARNYRKYITILMHYFQSRVAHNSYYVILYRTVMRFIKERFSAFRVISIKIIIKAYLYSFPKRLSRAS